MWDEAVRGFGSAFFLDVVPLVSSNVASHYRKLLILGLLCREYHLLIQVQFM